MIKWVLVREHIVALELVPTVALTVCMELGWRASLYRQLGHSSIIAGSLPNFLVAILIALIFDLVRGDKIDVRPIRPALMSALALGGYEFAQLAIPGRTFDAFDLVATLIGAGVAYILLYVAYCFPTRRAAGKG